MTRTTKIVAAAGILLLMFVSAVFIAKVAWDYRFLDGYDASAPLNATVRAEEDRPDYHRVVLAFDGLPGMTVPAILDVPKDLKSPLPCVIFLYGIGQEKEFVDQIAASFTKAGFAIVCPDQYTRGERKLPKGNLIEDILAMRRRAALNVIETRRLVDYLQTRKDIAGDRIYLVGASFGAITGSTAAAFEPRIAAAVLTYGGGKLPVLFNSEASIKELGKWHGAISLLMQTIMSPADPIRYVAKIAPRPTLFQNGSHDTIVPAAAGQALFEAAGEPKKFIMYDSDHVGLDVANTIKVLNDSIDWLKSIDAQHTRTATTSGVSTKSPSSATAAAS